MQITFLFLGLVVAVLKRDNRVKKKEPNLTASDLLSTLAGGRDRITNSGYNLSKFVISRMKIKWKVHRQRRNRWTLGQSHHHWEIVHCFNFTVAHKRCGCGNKTWLFPLFCRESSCTWQIDISLDTYCLWRITKQLTSTMTSGKYSATLRWDNLPALQTWQSMWNVKIWWPTSPIRKVQTVCDS